MSRNAYSLIALPDFPEFAQAVRYGVPATPKQLGIVSPVLRGKYRTEEPRKNRGAGPPLSVHLFEVKNAELTLTFPTDVRIATALERGCDADVLQTILRRMLIAQRVAGRGPCPEALRGGCHRAKDAHDVRRTAGGHRGREGHVTFWLNAGEVGLLVKLLSPS